MWRCVRGTVFLLHCAARRFLGRVALAPENLQKGENTHSHTRTHTHTRTHKLTHTHTHSHSPTQIAAIPLVLSFCQKCALLLVLRVSWPNTILRFLNIINVLNFDVDVFQVCSFAHSHTLTHTHTHTHTHIHTYTHTYTHTRTTHNSFIHAFNPLSSR